MNRTPPAPAIPPALFACALPYRGRCVRAEVLGPRVALSTILVPRLIDLFVGLGRWLDRPDHSHANRF